MVVRLSPANTTTSKKLLPRLKPFLLFKIPKAVLANVRMPLALTRLMTRKILK